MPQPDGPLRLCKKKWALHVLVHFKILFHLPPLIIFENNALESGHLLLLGLAVLRLPQIALFRKKDKDKKKGADKKKAINEDSVAANKKGAAAESWPVIAESWGGETHMTGDMIGP